MVHTKLILSQQTKRAEYLLMIIQLIIYINNPPNIEFKTNFNTFFIGNMNILPIRKIKQIHAKNVIIFPSNYNHLKKS
jgi:hypothetical protein